MKTACRIAVTTTALLSVAGCGHKTKSVLPPQAQAPTVSPANMAYTPSMPTLPPLPTPSVVSANEQAKNVAPPPPPRHVTRHKSSPAKSALADPASPSAEKSDPATQVASGGPGEGSPLGQLSSTGESVNTQGRHEIEQLITTTTNGLNSIRRQLSSEEGVTATQIKTFLAKARQALIDNDLDGAQTLATKAKVLLDELTTKK